MTRYLAGATLVLAALTTVPVHAAADMYLAISGTKYRVGLNGVFSSICRLKSIQIVPPTLVGDGESFPVARVKKGEALGTVRLRLVGDAESFPFDVDLKDVTVSDAAVRQNGTWSMTVRWSNCSLSPRGQ
jgi:hypothetical protein